MLKKYKVRYGSSVLVVDRPDGTTVGDLKRDDTLRASLGYGDNVNALFNGVALSDSALAPEFVENFSGSAFSGAIVIETACNKKEQSNS